MNERIAGDGWRTKSSGIGKEKERNEGKNSERKGMKNE